LERYVLFVFTTDTLELFVLTTNHILSCKSVNVLLLTGKFTSILLESKILLSSIKILASSLNSSLLLSNVLTSPHGRYLTSDFVGHMQRILKKKFNNSNVLYFNGGLGVLIAPLYANVWEPSERFPITGDGSEMPAGAINVAKNFRRTFLIGRELANAVEKTILSDSNKIIPPKEFIHKFEEFYTRITNFKFRLGLAALKPGNRSLVGFTKRKGYICTDHQNPTDETCKEDDFQNTPTPIPFVSMRLGDYGKTITSLVDFGPVKWLTVPGESPPELFVGLPQDFYTNTNKYYEFPQFHAFGDKYKIPGYGRNLLNCNNNNNSCWYIGLGGDQLGYFVPISDYRVLCLFGELICKTLPLTFKEQMAMSGEDCAFIFEKKTRS